MSGGDTSRSYQDVLLAASTSKSPRLRSPGPAGRDDPGVGETVIFPAPGRSPGMSSRRRRNPHNGGGGRVN